MKSYKLLSRHSMDFRVNDPQFSDMWYIVSVNNSFLYLVK